MQPPSDKQSHSSSNSISSNASAMSEGNSRQFSGSSSCVTSQTESHPTHSGMFRSVYSSTSKREFQVHLKKNYQDDWRDGILRFKRGFLIYSIDQSTDGGESMLSLNTVKWDEENSNSQSPVMVFYRNKNRPIVYIQFLSFSDKSEFVASFESFCA